MEKAHIKLSSYSRNLDHLLSSIRTNPIVKIKRNVVADSGAFYLHNKNVLCRVKLKGKNQLADCYICKEEFIISNPSPREKQEQRKLIQVLNKEVIGDDGNGEKGQEICITCSKAISEISKMRDKVIVLEEKIDILVKFLRKGINPHEKGISIIDKSAAIDHIGGIATEVKVEEDEICEMDFSPIIEPDTDLGSEGIIEENRDDIVVQESGSCPASSIREENTNEDSDSDYDNMEQEDSHSENDSDNPDDKHVQKTLKKSKENRSKRLICKVCQKTFANAVSLKKHTKVIHLKDEVFKCSLCSYTCFRKDYISEHKLKMHGLCKGEQIVVKVKRKGGRSSQPQPDPSICHLCGVSFKYPDYLIDHIKAVHDKIKDHKCTICSYSTYRKRQLKKHMLKHRTREEKKKCEDCGESFASLRERIVHVRSVHLNKETFSCNLCSFVAITKHNLDVHRMLHLKEKKTFTCQNFDCGEDFKTMNKLVWHQVTECFVVGVAEEERERIKIRMESYRDKNGKNRRKFPCLKCSKDFTKQTSLDLHLEQKHGE